MAVLSLLFFSMGVAVRVGLADDWVPTPPDAPLPDDAVTVIRCAWPETTKLAAPYTFSEDFTAAAGNYSYKVYVPAGYSTHPDWKYPAFFVMSPNGNADLGTLKDRAREEGWVIVLLVEAKNGAWGTIYGDMLAAHADAVQRLRIQEGLKFATGFSGGARGTSMLTQICPGFAGELLQGAGFAFNDVKGHAGFNVLALPKTGPYSVFLGMGTRDENQKEVANLQRALGSVPFRMETFEGGHQWSPLEIVRDGVDWLLDQTLTGREMGDEMRPFALRHFDYLAGHLEAEADGGNKTERIKEAIRLADKLGLDGDEARAAKVAALKALLDK